MVVAFWLTLANAHHPWPAAPSCLDPLPLAGSPTSSP
jgi:hypothetical protein